MALAAAAQELPCLDKGTVEVKAPLTGWLLKRKNSKAVSRVISSTNRRFFTLDFTGQVLYYSHSESSKSVSQPLAFRHILGVEPLCVSPAEAQQGDEERPSSQSSKGSGFRMPKMPSLPGLGKRPSLTEQHGFTLVCASKSLELVCSSQTEAEMWIDAIREAIALGSSEKYRSSEAKAEISTAPGSSRDSPVSKSPRSEAAHEDSDEEGAQDDAEERTVNLVELAAQKAKEQAAWEAEPALEDSASSGGAAVAAQERGSDIIEEVPVAAVAIPKDDHADDSDALALESTRSEHRVPALPPKLPKPTRPIEPPASTDAAAEDRIDGTYCTEGEEVIREIDGKSPSNDAQAWQASCGNASVQRSASERYADKAEGLTLAQRMSQLDFSDDEDDDAEGDDKPSGETPEVCSADPVTSLGASGKKTGVVIEACESFVQDADSEED
eukprot:TRINITY_DN47724_c0_g1_i1.p1 TRINITY_DN47724_c0_g1~~TRINITY_DN47724_c0_g1_i1.p1  ORF type:complete len:465 (+),score=125.78 TRINITY_DN47724_c0_g1_i1:74-1396(+)